jgi:tRNA(Ile)-lysidine synthase
MLRNPAKGSAANSRTYVRCTGLPMLANQEQLIKALRKSQLIVEGDRVLVAVSGGPDSVALLHILCELREEFALHLEVAHLEHGIRGQEAKDDARFVQEVARRLKLPVHIREVGIPLLRSQAGKGNMEALARQERYRFFSEVMRQRNLNKVAIAHNQDDQAETVLMWLLRGAGMKGLGGMAPLKAINVKDGDSSNRVVIIRPLLGVAKGDLLDFLEGQGLEYRRDRTNEDRAYLRNWLRMELIPRLKVRIDPRLSVRLAQSAEVLRDEDRLLDSLAQNELKSLANNDGLSRERFLRQPKAMQRRVLRLWIEQARGHVRGLDFDHGEALLRLISNGPAQGRLSIPGGWELIKEYDTLRLSKAARRPTPVCYSYRLAIGDEMDIPEAGVRIESQVLSSPMPHLAKDPWEAFFDLGALGGPLTLRNFRRGDRFQPFGMAGHKKVKELFIEKKVPRAARAALPLLVMCSEVLWIPGYGRSEIGRIVPGTQEILWIRAVGDHL